MFQLASGVYILVTCGCVDDTLDIGFPFSLEKGNNCLYLMTVCHLLVFCNHTLDGNCAFSRETGNRFIFVVTYNSLWGCISVTAQQKTQVLLRQYGIMSWFAAQYGLYQRVQGQYGIWWRSRKGGQHFGTDRERTNFIKATFLAQYGTNMTRALLGRVSLHMQQLAFLVGGEK